METPVIKFKMSEELQTEDESLPWLHLWFWWFMITCIYIFLTYVVPLFLGDPVPTTPLAQILTFLINLIGLFTPFSVVVLLSDIFGIFAFLFPGTLLAFLIFLAFLLIATMVVDFVIGGSWVSLHLLLYNRIP